MKIKRMYNLREMGIRCLLILFTLLLLVACLRPENRTEIPVIPENTKVEPTLTISSSPTRVEATAFFTPSATVAPETSTPFPAATLAYFTPTATLFPPMASSEDSETYVLSLFQNNGGCELPCIWGIIPGETSIEYAEEFFTRLKWKTGWYTYKDGIRSDLTAGTGLELYQHISPQNLTLNNNQGIVDAILWSPRTRDYANFYYSMKQILSRLGSPGEVVVLIFTGLEIETPKVTGYEVWLVYRERGLLAWYGGRAILNGDSYRFCPSNLEWGKTEKEAGKYIGYASLFVNSPYSPISVDKRFGAFTGGTAAGGIPIEQAAGITAEEFTQEMIKERVGEYCIDSPRSVWP